MDTLYLQFQQMVPCQRYEWTIESSAGAVAGIRTDC